MIWTVLYWLCQCVGWGAYVALGLLITRTRFALSGAIVGGYLLFFAYSIALTHGMRRMIERRDWLGLAPFQSFWRIASGAIAVSVIQTSLVLLVDHLWIGGDSPPSSLGLFLAYWSNVGAATGVWTGLYVAGAMLHRSRGERLQAAALAESLRSARLKALEDQTNPHFLFNALNTIRGLVVEDPGLAQDMITRLANLLRHSLQRSAKTTVPLAEEMAIVRDYLRLEGVRFEDRMRVEIDIPRACESLLVPPLLMQTLAENAVKHGLARLPEGGLVRIEASVASPHLHLRVLNTGTLGDGATSGTQVGLANLRERLRLLYGPRATFTLRQTRENLVEAVVRLPI